MPDLFKLLFTGILGLRPSWQQLVDVGAGFIHPGGISDGTEKARQE